MTEIFINGSKLDLYDDTSVALTYKATETDNPTTTKNTYSKTITVPGTKNNNFIFQNLWKLDNNQNKLNPKNRIDAVITKDGNIIHKGYIKINQVDVRDNETSYSFTFYGNTGDFFYNLMYDEEGNEKTLGDLYYHFQDEDGNEYSEMTEKTSYIADWESYWIKESWTKLSTAFNPNDKKVNNWITAVPTYSGYYDDFDSNKILVNQYYSMPQALRNLFPHSGTTKGSFLLVETERDLDEWEMKDFRCTRQKPGVRNSLILEAISNPENNGGYEVEWDSTFTSMSYYKDTWAVFDRMDFDNENVIQIQANLTPIDIAANYNNWNESYLINNSNNTTYFDTSSLYQPTVELSYIPTLSGNSNSEYAYMSFSKDGWLVNIGGIGIWTEIYDGNTLIDDRKYYFLTNPIFNTSWQYELEWYMPQIKEVMGVDSETDVKICYFDGQLRRFDNISGLYGLVNAPWTYKQYVNKSQNIRIKLGFGYFGVIAKGEFYYTIPQIAWTDTTRVNVTNTAINIVPSYNKENGIYDGVSDFQNTKRTKNDIFGKTSPFKYLTDYCKMFHLKIFCDKFKKKIKILKTRNYYVDKTYDLRDSICYDKGYRINPQIADKKWMKYGLNQPETYAQYLYNKKNNVEYGAYKLDTNENFSNEVEKPFDTNIFKSVISYKRNSQYLNQIKVENTNYNYPSVALMQKYTVHSWSGDTEYDKVVYGYANNHNIPIVADPTSPKPCMFDNDNESVDTELNLLFFNGMENVSDFFLSDYNKAMEDINGNECWVLSWWGVSAYLSDEDKQASPSKITRIGQTITAYPRFDIYKTSNNTVVDSLDFAEPKQMLNGVGNYDNRYTIYNRFWKKQQEDLYDEDTVEVELYVFLPNISLNDMFRQFYFFEDNLWIMTQINDWNVTSGKPTKCTFVKVNSKSNYLS